METNIASSFTVNYNNIYKGTKQQYIKFYKKSQNRDKNEDVVKLAVSDNMDATKSNNSIYLNQVVCDDMDAKTPSNSNIYVDKVTCDKLSRILNRFNKKTLDREAIKKEKIMTGFGNRYNIIKKIKKQAQKYIFSNLSKNRNKLRLFLHRANPITSSLWLDQNLIFGKLVDKTNENKKVTDTIAMAKRRNHALYNTGTSVYQARYLLKNINARVQEYHPIMLSNVEDNVDKRSNKRVKGIESYLYNDYIVASNKWSGGCLTNFKRISKRVLITFTSLKNKTIWSKSAITFRRYSNKLLYFVANPFNKLLKRRQNLTYPNNLRRMPQMMISMKQCHWAINESLHLGIKSAQFLENNNHSRIRVSILPINTEYFSSRVIAGLFLITVALALQNMLKVFHRRLSLRIDKKIRKYLYLLIFLFFSFFEFSYDSLILPIIFSVSVFTNIIIWKNSVNHLKVVQKKETMEIENSSIKAANEVASTKIGNSSVKGANEVASTEIGNNSVVANKQALSFWSEEDAIQIFHNFCRGEGMTSCDAALFIQHNCKISFYSLLASTPLIIIGYFVFISINRFYFKRYDDLFFIMPAYCIHKGLSFTSKFSRILTYGTMPEQIQLLSYIKIDRTIAATSTQPAHRILPYKFSAYHARLFNYWRMAIAKDPQVPLEFLQLVYTCAVYFNLL